MVYVYTTGGDKAKIWIQVCLAPKTILWLMPCYWFRNVCLPEKDKLSLSGGSMGKREMKGGN